MQSTIPEKFFRIFFNAFVLLMPIMILPYGIGNVSKYVFFVVVSSLVLFIFFLKMLESRALVNIKPIFIFILALFLSTALSVNIFTSVFGSEVYREGLITYLLYIVVFLSIITFVKTKEQMLYISLCLSIGVFINNIIGIIDIFFKIFVEGNIFGPRIITTFLEPNLLGGFIITALPLVLSAFYLSNNVKIKIFTFLNLVLTIGVLIFSGSRAALIGILISLIIFIPYLRKMKYKWLLIVFTLLIVACLNPFLFERLKADTFMSDLHFKLSIMKSHLKYLAVNPLFGTGPDTLKFFKGGYVGFGRAHSELINLTQNLGLFGLVAFLFIFFNVLLKGFQYMRRSTNIPSALYLISITSFIIFFFISYSRPIINIFFWISMALVVCISNMETTNTKFIRLPRINFLLPFVSVFCVLLILLALRIPIGVMYWRQAHMNQATGSYVEAVEKYKMAVKMLPDSEFFLMDLGNLAIELAEKGDPRFLPLAEESFNKIITNISPNDPAYIQRLEEIKKLSK